MRTIILGTVLLLTIAFSFTGCGEGDFEIEGYWKVDSIQTFYEDSIHVTQYDLFIQIYDGKVDFCSSGYITKETSTYTLTTENGEALFTAYSGGEETKSSFKNNGADHYYLMRKAGTTPSGNKLIWYYSRIDQGTYDANCAEMPAGPSNPNH